MLFNKRITFRLLVFLLLSDILETAIHLCFKKSTFALSGVNIMAASDLLPFFFQIFSSPFLWLGLTFVAATFIIWATILSKIDLSVAVPICSFSYIMVPLVSIIFLHEHVSLLRWTGILFIITGIIFVSLSSKEEKAANV